jgi:hypothetical protein
VAKECERVVAAKEAEIKDLRAEMAQVMHTSKTESIQVQEQLRQEI